MRRTIKLLTFAAMLAVFAVPALAQSKECNDENKAAWYQKFLDNFRGDPDKQKVAYDAAATYRDACPADSSDAQRAYMQKFIDAYDKLHKDVDTGKQLEAAINSKNYAEQMRIGKLVLANDPDNVKVYIIMGVAGLNDAHLLSDSSTYAKKAIEMIEGGKPFAPLFEGNREKALANLNYAVAKSTAATSPTDAISYFLKAARFESEQKRNAQLYLDLADAYEKGPRAKLSDEYKSKIAPDGTETPESKLVLANLNQVVDRQIDAWARAEALATDANAKKLIMDDLTALYKYRNKSETGLPELVASILSKPLPDVPTPITSLPTQTPASTPATNGSPAGTSGPAGSNGAGAQNGNKTTTGPKPSATPAPANKPKQPRRANHRRA